MTGSFRDNDAKSPKMKSLGLGREHHTAESEKYKYDL